MEGRVFGSNEAARVGALEVPPNVRVEKEFCQWSSPPSKRRSSESIVFNDKLTGLSLSLDRLIMSVFFPPVSALVRTFTSSYRRTDCSPSCPCGADRNPCTKHENPRRKTKAGALIAQDP
jgi:hypothetical protein